MPNLPAPYVSPWKELARNLRALGADLRLRVQELWRRNREGDLSVPGFWPMDLAPLFWPLLLAVSLALLVSAGVQLNAWRAETLSRDATSSEATESPRDSIETEMPLAPSPLPVPIRELPAPEPMPPEVSESPPVVEAPQPPVELQLDPLLDLFLDGSAPAGVLDAAQPDPAVNRLLLRLTEAWWELPPAQRVELAEDWQRRSRDLGYSELHLVNDQDRLLARSARVGDGMILFNNVPPA